MGEKDLLILDFFRNIHQKDAFFDKILDEASPGRTILKQTLILVLFSAMYGLVMGSYNGLAQALSSAVKVPLLFLFIILICFPAFYVIQSILGSKLSLLQMFSVILSGFVLTASIMISFATIVIFFMVTGDNYSFIKLLHVAVIILSGLFGMRTIIEALKFSCEKKNIYPKIGVQVFKFWIVILAFVGAQLSWTLRPFIGDKNLPFVMIRAQEGNFYKALIMSLENLLRVRSNLSSPRKDSEIKGDPPAPLPDAAPESSGDPDAAPEDKGAAEKIPPGKKDPEIKT